MIDDIDLEPDDPDLWLTDDELIEGAMDAEDRYIDQHILGGR